MIVIHSRIYFIVLVCLYFGLNKALGQVAEGVPCETPDEEYGTCISIKSCPLLLNLLITQNSDQKVVNYLRSSTCGYIGNIPKVCCPRPKPKNINPFDFTTEINSEVVTTPNNNNNNNIKLLKPPSCGYAPIPNTRVVGGVNATLDQFPWMVALGYKNKKNPNEPKWLCGASLITNRHVLTAAHCVYGRSDLYLARLGDLDLYSDTDGAHPVTISIINAKIHENYSSTKYTNDIAILKLKEAPNHPKIWPICLPLEEPLRSKNLTRYNLIIAGWGSIYFNGPSSSILQLTSIPVVDNESCKKVFTNLATIDDNVLCAGYAEGGKDACRGDSGGPLMHGVVENRNFVYHQIGIVSYGFKCAEPRFPGVYTRITSYLDWIEKNLN